MHATSDLEEDTVPSQNRCHDPAYLINSRIRRKMSNKGMIRSQGPKESQVDTTEHGAEMKEKPC